MNVPDRANSLRSRWYRGPLSAMVFLVILAPLASAIHELGHGLTAMAYGSRITRLVIGPTLQVYPKLKWVQWTNHLGTVDFWPELLTPTHRGLEMLMGSGANAIVACLLLFLMLLLPCLRIWRFQAVAVLLFGWDIITYSLLPPIGLKHLFVIGGTFAEPVEGAAMLGLPRGVFYLLLSVYIIVLHSLLWCSRVRAVKRSNAGPLAAA